MCSVGYSIAALKGKDPEVLCAKCKVSFWRKKASHLSDKMSAASAEGEML